MGTPASWRRSRIWKPFSPAASAAFSQAVPNRLYAVANRGSEYVCLARQVVPRRIGLAHLSRWRGAALRLAPTAPSWSLLRLNRDLLPLQVHVLPLKRQDLPWPIGGVEERDDDRSKVRVGCIEQLCFLLIGVEQPVVRDFSLQGNGGFACGIGTTHALLVCKGSCVLAFEVIVRE